MRCDSPKNIEECIEHGVEGILFGDYPWNQDSSLLRKENWLKVLDYIN